MSNCNVITLSSYSNSVKVMDIAWFFFASKDLSRVWSPYIFVYMVATNNRVKSEHNRHAEKRSKQESTCTQIWTTPSNFLRRRYLPCPSIITTIVKSQNFFLANIFWRSFCENLSPRNIPPIRYIMSKCTCLYF